tara:strand:+ start:1007 stop:1822 length:816 start_codon:yes stop_codon:yes gene_type:complete
MATYKSNAGAILQPGNQINKLSSFNNEGVFGWPGIEAFEQIGFVKINNASADKASFKSFDITVPSPDRRVDDRVRDDRTSLVVQASSERPAYVYGASIALAQDDPSGGLPSFPASPITADLVGTNTELLLLGPANGAVPFGVPTTQLNGLAAASSSIAFSGTTIAQGTGDTTNGDIPFWTSVTATIARADAANSMMFKVTSNTTFKVFNIDAITDTSVNGDGVSISADDITAGKAAYLVCRVNYLRPAKQVEWSDISSFIDFASQVGGNDS